MNGRLLKLILFSLASCLFSATALGQTLQGVVFQKGTGSRISGAVVINLRSNHKMSTDGLGTFNIPAFLGDTLEIRAIGFLTQKRVVQNFSVLFVHLQTGNELSEVIIYGKNLKQELQEVEDQFRSKGIYYKGKPPLALLSPFGGSPLTFFHELLSKDGKRARRFSKYAERELEYYEIASRFNDRVIKSTVPIKVEELEDFKTAYLPSLEQLRSWNDFDLLNYLKRSYEEFKKDRAASK
ncbi:hypothetical protein [Pedobacter sp. SYSU D00535]|uniref:hypothetical protein n=1 Tax=Pedobacter sp. SYSU D00535 TaxID=2810308 RepID=UPI001A97202F|nr:hypothetical protein [Pedobacter sp. SYSU D00535]